MVRKIFYAKTDVPLESNTGFNAVENAHSIAFLAALFYAVIPYSVRYTTYFVNHNFVIPIAILFTGWFWDTLWKNKSRAVAGALITLFLMPFFHGVCFFAIPAAFIMLFIRWFY